MLHLKTRTHFHSYFRTAHDSYSFFKVFIIGHMICIYDISRILVHTYNLNLTINTFRNLKDTYLQNHLYISNHSRNTHTSFISSIKRILSSIPNIHSIRVGTYIYLFILYSSSVPSSSYLHPICIMLKVKGIHPSIIIHLL